MSERRRARLAPLAVMLAAAGVSLSGCALTRLGQIAPLPPAIALPATPAGPSASLYSPARYTGLATDLRASRVGDILTIRLVERTTARKSASADAARDSSTKLSLPDARPFSYVPDGLLSGGASQSFKGSGEAQQENRLSGELTVTVAAVLPNGVLAVQGEKRLTLNRGEEQVQLTGLVRAADIGPDNSIPSTRVADARIRYSGTGEIADHSRQGWLARFFAKVSPL